MQIGAQFYTIREHCKTLDDFAESLKRVADIGYRVVQVSGTCPFEGRWLKEQLDRSGLTCCVTHTPPAELKEDAAAVARKHDVFGCDYVGLGYFPFGEEEGNRYEDFLQAYRPVAKALKENGKYFMYHNHDREFQKLDGKLILQRLSEEFSPEEMGFILDTYWVQAGGGDPAWWIEHLAGRVPCIHLKDFAFDRKMAVIGEGNINFDRVFEKAEAAGTRYMLVEQDDCGGEDPFACLTRSYRYLKAQGFE